MRMIPWLALIILCQYPSRGMGANPPSDEPEGLMFRPGQVWLDTDGRPIQAHGGGMLFHDGVYYWYGENKDGPTLNKNRVDIIGISCYSSRDLYRWKFEGLALKAVQDDTSHDFQRPGPPTGREAPALFKHQGRYYLITSGTTGWACNEALYAVAESIAAHNECETGEPQVKIIEETIDNFSSGSEIRLPAHSLSVLKWENLE